MSAYNRSTAYHWYLGQDFWRERREHILRRANYICEKCGKRPARVIVRDAQQIMPTQTVMLTETSWPSLSLALSVTTCGTDAGLHCTGGPLSAA